MLCLVSLSYSSVKKLKNFDRIIFNILPKQKIEREDHTKSCQEMERTIQEQDQTTLGDQKPNPK